MKHFPINFLNPHTFTTYVFKASLVLICVQVPEMALATEEIYLAGTVHIFEAFLNPVIQSTKPHIIGKKISKEGQFIPFSTHTSWLFIKNQTD